MLSLIRRYTTGTVTGISNTVVRKYTPFDLQLRVGHINSIKRHENADKLFVSQIGVGGDKELQICSGLVDLVPMEELHNSNVIVVENIKKSKMRGVVSEGMLLCAETQEGHVQPVRISPHEDIKVGDLLKWDNDFDVENRVYKKLSKNGLMEAIEGMKIGNNNTVEWHGGMLVGSSIQEGFEGSVVR